MVISIVKQDEIKCIEIEYMTLMFRNKVKKSDIHISGETFSI